MKEFFIDYWEMCCLPQFDFIKEHWIGFIIFSLILGGIFGGLNYLQWRRF